MRRSGYPRGIPLSPPSQAKGEVIPCRLPPWAGRGKRSGILSLLLLAAILFPLASPAVQGSQGPHSLPPQLQLRYQHLTGELRCPVCQNEPIGTSQSRIAANLRRTVREQLLAGKSDQQIRNYMISRYGLFAVYDPPMTAGTWLLWFGPLILLVIAALTGFMALCRRRRLLAGTSRRPAAEAAEEGARRPHGEAPR